MKRNVAGKNPACCSDPITIMTISIPLIHLIHVFVDASFSKNKYRRFFQVETDCDCVIYQQGDADSGVEAIGLFLWSLCALLSDRGCG